VDFPISIVKRQAKGSALFWDITQYTIWYVISQRNADLIYYVAEA
jgi:hypothetical protein